MSLNTIIIMVVSAILTFMFGRLSTRLNKKEKESNDREKRLSELERKQSIMETKAEPIIAAFLAMSIKTLTHFHTPTTDEILEKITPPFEQTEEEIEELAEAMNERMNDISGSVGEAEKIHAKIIPDLVRLAKIEAQEEGAIEVEIQIVKVPIAEIPEKDD